MTLTNRRLLSRLKAFLRFDAGRRRLGDDVFTGGLAAQKHLLRAVHGGRAVVNNTLQLTSDNKGLLEDLQLLLLGFGIQSGITDDAGSDGLIGDGGAAATSGGEPLRSCCPIDRPHTSSLPWLRVARRACAVGWPGPVRSRGDAESRRHGLRIDPGSLRSFAKHVGLLPGKKLEQLAGRRLLRDRESVAVRRGQL